MLRLVLAGAVIAVAAWLLASGALSGLSDQDAFQERIQGWGALGPIGFVVIMWAVQPFGVPGVFFMVPASLVWSAPVACGLSWIGNMGASTIAFEASRRVGQDWVRSRIPERLHRFDDRLTAGGVWPILALRLVTGQIPAADWLLGVSSVRRIPFLIGTGIGIIPTIVLLVVFGADILAWLRDHPVAAIPLVVLAVGRRVVQKRKRREAPDETDVT